MTHAYTPAFDFNPKETENMTDKEIMELLTRDMDNWEKGKLLRAAFDAQKPSALSIKPKVERKKRQPKPVLALTNGAAGSEQPDNAH